MKTLTEDGSMRTQRMIDNERGIALVVVLLVVLAVAAIIAGAALLGSNTSLIAKHQARLSVLETVADAGLEEARSRINGNKAQYPDSGYNILEAGVAVYDASGAVIPNVKRWLYVGPSGVTSGQYGVFGSVVSVAQDPQGNRVIRRGEVYQESFSKYAYFTTIEGAIVFANGDQIQGPVHLERRHHHQLVRRHVLGPRVDGPDDHREDLRHLQAGIQGARAGHSDAEHGGSGQAEDPGGARRHRRSRAHPRRRRSGHDPDRVRGARPERRRRLDR